MLKHHHSVLIALGCLAFAACNDETPFFPYPYPDAAGDTAGPTDTGDTTDPDAPDAPVDVGEPDSSTDTGPRPDTSRDVGPDRDVSDRDVPERDVPDRDVGPDRDVIDRDVPDRDVRLDGDDGPPVARAGCTVASSGAPLSSDVVVPPLSTLVCSGGASVSASRFAWSVIEAPAGSTSRFIPDDVAETEVFIDLAGTYLLRLEVTSTSGETDVADVSVAARPDRDLEITLTWRTPGDPDETNPDDSTVGSDLDLHLLHPSGCWESTQWDCHFRARQPNWGSTASDADDPSMDIDDTNGAGPESISFDNPDRTIPYLVGVHYYDDHFFGEAHATVRVYMDGALVWTSEEQELSSLGAGDGEWWVVGAIDWEGRRVERIGAVSDDVPTCE